MDYDLQSMTGQKDTVQLRPVVGFSSFGGEAEVISIQWKLKE